MLSSLHHAEDKQPKSLLNFLFEFCCCNAVTHSANEPKFTVEPIRSPDSSFCDN
jgi:hypothetical protein